MGEGQRERDIIFKMRKNERKTKTTKRRWKGKDKENKREGKENFERARN